MDVETRSKRLQRLGLLSAEGLLWFAAALCAVFLCLVGVRAMKTHQASLAIVQAAPHQGNAADPGARSASNPDPPKSDVIGRLEIPELGLSVPILADYDPASLRLGVGHIKGTAVPGGLGTVGLAGHRDTYLRPLRGIKIQMEIRLVDTTGTYRYLVDSTEIVTPDRVDVLDIGTMPEMTLITCYPFDFIGAAPKRFIVHAHLVSASPDTEAAPRGA